MDAPMAKAICVKKCAQCQQPWPTWSQVAGACGGVIPSHRMANEQYRLYFPLKASPFPFTAAQGMTVPELAFILPNGMAWTWLKDGHHMSPQPSAQHTLAVTSLCHVTGDAVVTSSCAGGRRRLGATVGLKDPSSSSQKQASHVHTAQYSDQTASLY